MRSRIYSSDEVSEFDAELEDTGKNGEVDIKADQHGKEDEEDVAHLNLQSYDLLALGLTAAIGGHFISWSSGLTAGFGSYIVALFVTSLAYYSLILCIAELSSALPFAGGVYGIARVTLGVYPGFLVAVMDSYRSIVSTAFSAWAVGKIMISVTQGDDNMLFLYWFLFYLYCLAINGYGGRIFWRINKLSAAISVTLLLVFIFGSIKFAHFDENAPVRDEQGPNKWFQGGLRQFMVILPAPSRFFVGIQSINLACGQIKDPKVEVPKAYSWCVSIVVITCIAVTFAACSLPPGILSLAQQSYPLTPGFALIFDVPPRYALIATVPATLFFGSTYTYFFGQKIRAMGNSKLIHPIFGHDSYRNTPVFAHLAGAAIGYAVCIVEYHFGDVDSQLNHVSILGAMVTYIAILVSYILFHNYFPTIKREYTSPLGNYGAVYSLIVFVLCTISIAGFQKNHDAFVAFIIVLALSSVYYYFVVTKRQVFSEEEKKVMFTAYLVKTNRTRAERIKKGIHVRARIRTSFRTAPCNQSTSEDSAVSDVMSGTKRSDDNSVSVKHLSRPTSPAYSDDRQNLTKSKVHMGIEDIPL